MGKSPKLFCYGYQPGMQFGIFGGPTLVSEVPLPKPKGGNFSGHELDRCHFLSGASLNILFKQQRVLQNCWILPVRHNPLPDAGPLLHHWFYQEGRFLVFLYREKRVWALCNELLVI